MAELLHPHPLRSALRHVLPSGLLRDAPSHNGVQPRFDKSRVVVCTLYDDGAPYGRLAAKINQRYTSLHGFQFVARYNTTYFQDRAPAWEKVGLILELLRMPQHDVVVWLDADAVLLPTATNATSLASVLDHHMFTSHGSLRSTRQVDSKDMIFSADRNGASKINTGVMAFKDAPHAHKLLNRLARIGLDTAAKLTLWNNHSDNLAHQELRCQAYLYRRNWEQDCFKMLWDANADGMRDHSAVVPYGVLQSAVAPRYYFRADAIALHFMWGPSPLEPNNAADRMYGLRVLSEWIESTNETLSAERLVELPLVRPVTLRDPWRKWIGNASTYTPYGTRPG